MFDVTQIHNDIEKFQFSSCIVNWNISLKSKIFYV